MENTEPQKASKNKKKPILIIVALIVVLIIGAFFLRPDKKQTSTTDNPEIAVVQITDTGFVPATLSIKAGTVVKWQNADTKPHQVGANPYPNHSDLPELNSETILPGETYNYTFTKTGEVKYYDGNVLTSHGTVQVN